ncbi:hypothetical protein ON010_g14380 [Phytophthora cinnamomi]|nr:hypothetical protein ON010_g14380 [Phytophthora cinnamomi]
MRNSARTHTDRNVVGVDSSFLRDAASSWNLPLIWARCAGHTALRAPSRIELASSSRTSCAAPRAWSARPRSSARWAPRAGPRRASAEAHRRGHERGPLQLLARRPREPPGLPDPPARRAGQAPQQERGHHAGHQGPGDPHGFPQEPRQGDDPEGLAH